MTGCDWSLRCLKLFKQWLLLWLVLVYWGSEVSAPAMEDKDVEPIIHGAVLGSQTHLYSCLPVLMKSWVDALQFEHGFSVSVLQMSHAAVSGLCRAIKLQCELYSSRQIAICLDPYCGLGFVLWCLCRYNFGGEKGRVDSWLVINGKWHQKCFLP